MNSLVNAGIIVGLIGVAIYIATGYHRKALKKLDLSDALHVFAAFAAFVASVRLLGFVFIGNFDEIVKQFGEKNMWSLSSGDKVIFVISAIAMCWTAVQTVIQPFAKLKP